MKIAFTKPRKSQNELEYMRQVISSGKTWGGGDFSLKSSNWLSKTLGCERVLITNSATDALEMAALLLDIKSGDEIIMPSFTFVSSANAFVLRGGIPVFIDVNEKTLNIDVNLIESSITDKTKAILIMNYGGFSCDIAKVKLLVERYKLFLIEDAAQSILAKYQDGFLGTFGDLACLSFHGTKNISCGEGGALLINNPSLIEKAEIILEKGTNRSKFIKGEVDKYTWIDLGSSYLASEIACAYLYGQLEEADSITNLRLESWNCYRDYFDELSSYLNIERINPESFSTHNGHIFYLILKDSESKNEFISEMAKLEIQCSSHYVPLHSAPAGSKFSKVGSKMYVTNRFSERLVRLPIWSDPGLPIEKILDSSTKILRRLI
jgi:dTDP-4-amino-4,6-dideoxygalactose transaminase